MTHYDFLRAIFDVVSCSRCFVNDKTLSYNKTYLIMNPTYFCLVATFQNWLHSINKTKKVFNLQGCAILTAIQLDHKTKYFITYKKMGDNRAGQMQSFFFYSRHRN